MTVGDGEGPLRIGTAERAAAMKALDDHLAAGRLGVEEYADRSAVAANATVAPELAALFTDLPAPHPPLPGVPMLPGAPVLPPTEALPVVSGNTAPAPAGAAAFLDTWGPRIVAITPILALLLFFATGNSWQWFLLIPLAGALVYGGGRGSGRDRRRND